MEIRKFKKKVDGIVIGQVEAVRLMPPNMPWNVANWCDGKVHSNAFVGESVSIIFDKDGLASFGEWIVKTNVGFFSCTDQFLKEEYDEIDTSYGEVLINAAIEIPDNAYLSGVGDLRKGLSSYIDKLHALSTEPTCGFEIKVLAEDIIAKLVDADTGAKKVFFYFKDIL